MQSFASPAYVTALQREESTNVQTRPTGVGQKPTLPSGCYRAVSFIASLPNAGAVEFSSTMPRLTDIGLHRIGCASVVP